MLGFPAPFNTFSTSCFEEPIAAKASSQDDGNSGPAYVLSYALQNAVLIFSSTLLSIKIPTPLSLKLANFGISSSHTCTMPPAADPTNIAASIFGIALRNISITIYLACLNLHQTFSII